MDQTASISEPISKLLSAAIGCKARGSALSAKTVLDVLQYASEPFSPPALPTSFSLNLASKSVLKWVLFKFNMKIGSDRTATGTLEYKEITRGPCLQIR